MHSALSVLRACQNLNWLAVKSALSTFGLIKLYKNKMCIYFLKNLQSTNEIKRQSICLRQPCLSASVCVRVCACVCMSLQVSFLKRAAMWSGLSKLVLIWVNTSIFSTTSFCTDTVNVTSNCGFTLFHPHC